MTPPNTHISASVVKHENDSVTVTIHGADLGSGPELIGTLEISWVPVGASVAGFNANDSTTEPTFLILHRA